MRTQAGEASTGMDMSSSAEWGDVRPDSSQLSSSLEDHTPGHPLSRPQASTLPRHLSRYVGMERQASRPSVLDRVASTRSLPSLTPDSRSASLDMRPEDSPLTEHARGDWRATAIGATPLDKTMDRIGMGRYQWTVLLLSGLGWAADNMWIQAVAIILPHIQTTFAVTDRVVGVASSSIFVGMFVGSLAWGSYSDSHGRRAAFNITLIVTAIFGTLSAFSPTFGVLCLLLFCVGTGVGGSMPTDSSNLVENLPVRNHSYVTALSVFFSAGAVVPSLIGLVVLSDKNESGWRWLLGFLALVTIAFVCARVIFFRLLESPKYLVHAGRPQEARAILQRIQNFNGGQAITIRLNDVRDEEAAAASGSGGDLEGARPTRPRPTSFRSTSRLHTEHKGYESLPTEVQDDEDEDDLNVGESGGDATRRNSVLSQPSDEAALPHWLQWTPEAWHASLADLVERYAELLSPHWKRTTVLIWIIWSGMSFAFTSFNVFLPKLLQERYGRQGGSAALSGDSSHAAMVDYLLYSLSGMPGSLIAAYMVETRLGRIGTMTISTAVTAISVLIFAVLEWRSSLTSISVFSSISYSAQFAYSAEVMSPKIRATACGSASAIGRLAGIVAPLVAGWLFALSSTLPLYLSVVTFAVVTGATALLPIETRGRGVTSEEGSPSIAVH